VPAVLEEQLRGDPSVVADFDGVRVQPVLGAVMGVPGGRLSDRLDDDRRGLGAYLVDELDVQRAGGPTFLAVDGLPCRLLLPGLQLDGVRGTGLLA
jgi:hypothetical protein